MDHKTTKRTIENICRYNYFIFFLCYLVRGHDAQNVRERAQWMQANDISNDKAAKKISTSNIDSIMKSIKFSTFFLFVHLFWLTEPPKIYRVKNKRKRHLSEKWITLRTIPLEIHQEILISQIVGSDVSRESNWDIVKRVRKQHKKQETHTKKKNAQVGS